MQAEDIVLRLLTDLHGAVLLAMLMYRRRWTRRARHAAIAVALVGIGLTLTGILRLVSMFAEDGWLSDPDTLSMFLFGTAAGWAALARIALLIALALVLRFEKPHVLALACSFAATACLAWNGHGAMTEGVLGWLHIAGDMVHLMAGLVWIAAIIAFLSAAIFHSSTDSTLPTQLHHFAKTGTILVALLLLTGATNMLFIVGWAEIPRLPGSAYGRLLLLKIILFVGMLAVAAVNRLWLVPRLTISSTPIALRASLGAELLLGVVVLALVAWFGTLDPAQ